MTTIRQILARKPEIYSIDPDATVFEALGLMEEKNIGALLVMKGGLLVGIFSERDYARRMILQGRTSRETPVREVMTSKVFVITPDTTSGECMMHMTDRHIRHLPVVEGGPRGGCDLDRRRGAQRDPRPALHGAQLELHQERLAAAFREAERAAARSPESRPLDEPLPAQPVEEHAEGGDAPRERHVPLLAREGAVPPVARDAPRPGRGRDRAAHAGSRHEARGARLREHVGEARGAVGCAAPRAGAGRAASRRPRGSGPGAKLWTAKAPGRCVSTSRGEPERPDAVQS